MRWTWQTVLFLAMIAIAFGNLAYAWKDRRADDRKFKFKAWRQAAVTIGFLAVTMQAILFILFWTHIGHDYVLFGKWARCVLPSFLIAVPCILLGKGKSRWLLLSSSIFLFVACFFIVLSA